MAGPKFRCVAKNKSNGTFAEFAVIWENERGQRNIQFVDQAQADASGGKKMTAISILSKPNDYFLNVYENTPGGGKSSRPAEGSDIEF